MPQRLHWLDSLRGLCMLLIVWFHTEMYYAGRDIVPYNMYVADALAIFFFISGYLTHSHHQRPLRRNIMTLMRSLLWPYIVFTTAMALPKAVAHAGATDMASLLRPIVMGQASWFVIALFVAKALFTLAERWSRAEVLMLLSFIVGGLTQLLPAEEWTHTWQWATALQMMPLLAAGFLLRQWEEQCMPRLTLCRKTAVVFCLMLMWLAALKALVWHMGDTLSMAPGYASNLRVLYGDTIAVSLIAVMAFRRLPQLPFLEWVGRNSIVFYFLCGGVPLIVSRLLSLAHFAYDGHYWHVPLAFLLTAATISAAVWLICRYARWSYRI